MQLFIFVIGKKNQQVIQSCALREKCSYSEFFWSVFPRIRAEHETIRSISPYSVQKQENTDQKNSEYGHFSRSGEDKKI